jgi:hypothetical protein
MCLSLLLCDYTHNLAAGWLWWRSVRTLPHGPPPQHFGLRDHPIGTVGSVRKATYWSISFPLAYFTAAAIAPFHVVALILCTAIPVCYVLPGVTDRHVAAPL